MALEIFRLVGSVFVDTDKANKSLHESDKKAEGLGTTLVGVVKTAGKFAAAFVGAATAVGTAMVALADNTREYRTEQGKLLTAFETSGFAAGDARSTYEELNGILGDSGQAVEAANHLSKLCTTTQELSTWTDICAGVYATFGDSLPIENLTEAANETAKTGALTGGLADALNWAGVNEDDFQAKLDQCTSEQERQALITETLNGLYADASDTYKDLNKDVIAANKAQDKLTNATAKAGKAVEPLVTKGKELLAKVLEKVIPHLEDLSETVIPGLNKAIDKTVGWFRKMSDSLKNIADWASKNKTALQLVAVAIGTLTTALIAYNAAQAIKKAGGIAELAQNAALAVGYYGLCAAQTAQTAATTIATAATTAFGAAVNFLTSPITLVVVAIGALIAIVVLLVKNWDTVKAAAGQAWDFIKQVWNSAASWFSTNVIQPIGNFFGGLWNGIKNTFSGVGSWFTNIFKSAVSGVKNVWSGITSWFGNLLDGVKKLFSDIGSAIGGIFKKPINTIINGINSFIRGLNKIKIPDWVPGVGGKGFSISTIPLLEEGAVLEKGQTGFLEGNGAEAVVPLHKNKKWISAVAEDMAASGLGGGTDTSKELLQAFLMFVAALPEMLTDALEKMRFEMNNREFARLVKAVK